MTFKEKIQSFVTRNMLSGICISLALFIVGIVTLNFVHNLTIMYLSIIPLCIGVFGFALFAAMWVAQKIIKNKEAINKFLGPIKKVLGPVFMVLGVITLFLGKGLLNRFMAGLSNTSIAGARVNYGEKGRDRGAGEIVWTGRDSLPSNFKCICGNNQLNKFSDGRYFCQSCERELIIDKKSNSVIQGGETRHKEDFM
jgi:hypothetical protein